MVKQGLQATGVPAGPRAGRGAGWRALLLSAWWRSGRAQQRGGGLADLCARGDGELAEPGFQQAQGAAHRVGPADRGLQAHDPLVEVLVVRVVAERGLQRGEAWPGLAGSRISAMVVQASSARRRAVSA